jgi:hypothetical protein
MANGSLRRSHRPCVRTTMSDDTAAPSPSTNDRVDPASDPKSTVADVSGAVKSAAHTVSDAVETGRKPSMPLSVLRNIARDLRYLDPPHRLRLVGAVK